MNMAEKNRQSWNNYAEQYGKFNLSAKMVDRIVKDPATAFHHMTWAQIQKYVPQMQGKQICVPSSGDNHAVFAFALLGAQVTSCDISENQLANAEKAAEALGIAGSIHFVRADTMALNGVEDRAYDFVYTSNGVHVWINDLDAMYRNVFRILKPGGVYIMHEIHPFLRPIDEGKIVKPYDMVGPFEAGSEVTFAWRVQDILNAILDSGVSLKHIEEMYAEKDYDWPFWIRAEDIIKGATATREEVDNMHDWTNNPMAALPNWMCVVGMK